MTEAGRAMLREVRARSTSAETGFCKTEGGGKQQQQSPDAQELAARQDGEGRGKGVKKWL